MGWGGGHSCRSAGEECRGSADADHCPGHGCGAGCFVTAITALSPNDLPAPGQRAGHCRPRPANCLPNVALKTVSEITVLGSEQTGGLNKHGLSVIPSIPHDRLLLLALGWQSAIPRCSSDTDMLRCLSIPSSEEPGGDPRGSSERSHADPPANHSRLAPRNMANDRNGCTANPTDRKTETVRPGRPGPRGRHLGVGILHWANGLVLSPGRAATGVARCRVRHAVSDVAAAGPR